MRPEAVVKAKQQLELDRLGCLRELSLDEREHQSAPNLEFTRSQSSSHCIMPWSISITALRRSTARTAKRPSKSIDSNCNGSPLLTVEMSTSPLRATTDVGGARYMAKRIPGAMYVELPGDDQLPFVGDQDSILDQVEEFLTGASHHFEPDRILATVLFTDIVGSTERAAALGDRRWRELLELHNRLVRGQLKRFRGREVDIARDGFLATFDGPAGAIRCAIACLDEPAQAGIQVKAGLHTGECELVGDKVRGISVHIGARVASLAAPGEVLVSSTVKDLVAGSGLEFEERGTHQLRGVSGEWRLFAVVV